MSALLCGSQKQLCAGTTPTVTYFPVVGQVGGNERPFEITVTLQRSYYGSVPMCVKIESLEEDSMFSSQLPHVIHTWPLSFHLYPTHLFLTSLLYFVTANTRHPISSINSPLRISESVITPSLYHPQISPVTHLASVYVSLLVSIF